MSQIYEAEIASGLHHVATDELKELSGVRGIQVLKRGDGVQFRYDGAERDLLKLRSVIAVYSVVQFDIPRPKALLGHQHFTRLIKQIHNTINLSDEPYQTLYLSAAGSDSSVMVRIKNELAQALNLQVDPSEGDLLLRVRRTPKKKQGWDVLVRLSPRPLATRDWRGANMEGALNGSVAHAMIRMLQPRETDQVLNIGCGSGTLLIERKLYCDADVILGCDISAKTLNIAEANIQASQAKNIQLMHCDAKQLPFPDSTFNALCVDLPFGQLVGSHEDNISLYPALLKEAARVAEVGAQFAVITHEVRLFEKTLAHIPQWRQTKTQKITLSGLHPRIYILERI